MRNPSSLTHDELAQFANAVQSLLYLDMQNEREFWNPDKEWDAADLLDELALVMQRYNLVPTTLADAPF